MNTDLVINHVSICHALMRQEVRLFAIPGSNRAPQDDCKNTPTFLPERRGFIFGRIDKSWIKSPAFHAGACGFEPRYAQTRDFAPPARGSGCTWLREQRNEYGSVQCNWHHHNVIAEYATYSEAQRAIGAPSMGHISRACQGKQKSAYGFAWREIHNNI